MCVFEFIYNVFLIQPQQKFTYYSHSEHHSQWVFQWNGKVVRITALIFTEDVEDKLQCEYHGCQTDDHSVSESFSGVYITINILCLWRPNHFVLMHKSSSFCIIIAITIVTATTTMLFLSILIIIMILVIMITTCYIIMIIILISIKISRTYTPLNIWWTMFWCKSPTNSISLATGRYFWSILHGRQYFTPDCNITAWNTWQCLSHWHILMGQRSILYIQTKGTKTSRHPSVAAYMNKQ